MKANDTGRGGAQGDPAKVAAAVGFAEAVPNLQQSSTFEAPPAGKLSGARAYSADACGTGCMSKVADAWGLAAWRVETPVQLNTALDAAFAQKHPAFLDIGTEPLVQDLPPVYSWLKTAGLDPLRRNGQ